MHVIIKKTYHVHLSVSSHTLQPCVRRIQSLHTFHIHCNHVYDAYNPYIQFTYTATMCTMHTILTCSFSVGYFIVLSSHCFTMMSYWYCVSIVYACHLKLAFVHLLYLYLLCEHSITPCWLNKVYLILSYIQFTYTATMCTTHTILTYSSHTLQPCVRHIQSLHTVHIHCNHVYDAYNPYIQFTYTATMCTTHTILTYSSHTLQPCVRCIQSLHTVHIHCNHVYDTYNPYIQFTYTATMCTTHTILTYSSHTLQPCVRRIQSLHTVHIHCNHVYDSYNPYIQFTYTATMCTTHTILKFKYQINIVNTISYNMDSITQAILYIHNINEDRLCNNIT